LEKLVLCPKLNSRVGPEQCKKCPWYNLFDCAKRRKEVSIGARGARKR
jgi:hypothetical protein